MRIQVREKAAESGPASKKFQFPSERAPYAPMGKAGREEGGKVR